MKTLGYFLITAGFLAGAFFAVRDPEAVAIEPYLVALLAGAAGVAAVRITSHRASRHEDRLAENLDTLTTSLARLVENAERFEEEKGSIDVYELRHHVEKTFFDDLQAFADARETIAHRYGLQPYADVISHFASGERHLNRVWSASTDGYVDEAHAYVTKGLEQLRETDRMLRELVASDSG